MGTNSLIAGDLGNINTSVICSSFTCICPSSRSVDSYVVYDASHPYSEEAISGPSQIFGFCTKIKPPRQCSSVRYLYVWCKLEMNLHWGNSWMQFCFCGCYFQELATCQSLPCVDGLNLWFASLGHGSEKWHQQKKKELVTLQYCSFAEKSLQCL